MSYDVTIGDIDLNITFNISGVFYDHIDGGLPSLDGKTGRQAGYVLQGFWSKIEKTRLRLWVSGDVGEPHMAEIYDSPNGWGSLIGALTFAGMLTSACAEFPRHRVRVFR